VKDGKVVNAVEYQDAHGFVLASDRLFQSLADELGRRDAAATDAIRAALNDLKAGWPSAGSAESTVKEPGAVLANVSRVELQLNRFR